MTLKWKVKTIKKQTSFCIARNISHLFSDCHIEKPWPVNQSVLGVKEQNRGTITFKNIGENETAELEQNSINLNPGKSWNHATYFNQNTLLNNFFSP